MRTAEDWKKANLVNKLLLDCDCLISIDLSLVS